MVTIVETGHSNRRSTPPRWTPTGNGHQRGQFCWPPAGSYMAATGQDLMAADRPEALTHLTASPAACSCLVSCDPAAPGDESVLGVVGEEPFSAGVVRQLATRPIDWVTPRRRQAAAKSRAVYWPDSTGQRNRVLGVAAGVSKPSRFRGRVFSLTATSSMSAWATHLRTESMPSGCSASESPPECALHGVFFETEMLARGPPWRGPGLPHCR